MTPCPVWNLSRLRSIAASLGAAAVVLAFAPFDTLASGAPEGDLPDTILAVAGARSVTLAMFARARATADASDRPMAIVQRLVDREVLATAALGERLAWTDADATHHRPLRDRLALAAALDSALGAEQRAIEHTGGQPPDLETLGSVVRDSTIARLAPSFSDALIGRLARAWSALPPPSADSSIAAQLRTLSIMPAVRPADTARVVARIRGDSLTVAELLAAWRLLAPALRPRVESAAQVRDLIRNALFERVLRRAAESPGIAGSAAVTAALEEARAQRAVERLLTREVLNRVGVDSLESHRRFDADPGAWALPARVRALRFDLDSQPEAAEVAARLSDAHQARILEAAARRGNLAAIEIAASEDSAFFAAAMRAGPGGVCGPDSAAAGWWVAKVEAVLPAQPRTFAEARPNIERRLRAESAERLTRALCDRLRASVGVRLNRAAIAALDAPR